MTVKTKLIYHTVKTTKARRAMFFSLFLKEVIIFTHAANKRTKRKITLQRRSLQTSRLQNTLVMMSESMIQQLIKKRCSDDLLQSQIEFFSLQVLRAYAV